MGEKERASIRFQRELLQARSEALIRAIEAGAQSYERRSNGTAKANALKYKYDAQLSLFKALKDSVKRELLVARGILPLATANFGLSCRHG